MPLPTSSSVRRPQTGPPPLTRQIGPLSLSPLVQLAGTLNQQNINIDPRDGGGEMDPHGADQVRPTDEGFKLPA